MNATDWTMLAINDGRLKLEDLILLVPYAQRELGVDDDGKAGKATLNALHEALGSEHQIVKTTVPIPKGRDAVKRVYGNPSWVKLPRGRSVDLDDAWEHKNIRSFKLHTGKRVRMHRLVGDEFVRLFKQACDESGYTPKSVQTFNPRVIGGTDRLSMHAYGIAFDVDPRDNPWGGRRKDGSPSLLRQNMVDCLGSGKRSFVQVFEDAGWCWGGRWKRGKGDDMHFQRSLP